MTNRADKEISRRLRDTYQVTGDRWFKIAAERIEGIAAPQGCCLSTPDPGPWTAGVDDSADLPMVDLMHSIRDDLSFDPSLRKYVKMLRSAAGVDSRTVLGRDIQRCLLHGAADRLSLLAHQVDPWPWRTRRQRLRDAWEVLSGRAAALCVTSTAYDSAKEGS